MTSIELAADLYFSSINPIAAKIKADINEISSNYEHLWYEFKPQEQNDVINEQLIKPDLIVKYIESMSSIKSKCKSPDNGTPSKSCFYDGRNLSTFAKIKTGLKKNHDDVSGISIRDEHSAPFSMKTKSQINLNIFGLVDQDAVDGAEKKHQIGKMKQPPPAPPSTISKRNSNIDSDGLSSIQQINVAFGDSCNLSNKNFLSKFMNFNGSSGSAGKANQENEYQFVSSMEPSNSLTSEEDNNVEEFSSLLKASELKKTYDFLQNW